MCGDHAEARGVSERDTRSNDNKPAPRGLYSGSVHPEVVCTGSHTLGVAGRSAWQALPNPGGRCPGLRTHVLSPPLFSQNGTVVVPSTILGSTARPQRRRAIPFSILSPLLLHQGEKPEFATVMYSVSKPRNSRGGPYSMVAVYFR